jgi:hypothetical protein
MSNSSDGAGLGFLLVLVTIGSWLGSGYMAWNWVNPHSFGSTLVFLFVWPICGYLVDTVLAFVIGSIMAILNK